MYIKLVLRVIKEGFRHSEDLGFDRRGGRFYFSQKQLLRFQDL